MASLADWTLVILTAGIAFAALVQAGVACWHYHLEKRSRKRRLQFLDLRPAFRDHEDWYRIDVVNPGLLAVAATHLNVAMFDGTARSMGQRYDFYVGEDPDSPPGLDGGPDDLKLSKNLRVGAGERATLFVNLGPDSQNYMMRLNLKLRGPGMETLAVTEYAVTPAGWRFNQDPDLERPLNPLEEEYEEFQRASFSPEVQKEIEAGQTRDLARPDSDSASEAPRLDWSISWGRLKSRLREAPVTHALALMLLSVYGVQLWVLARYGFETVKDIFLLQPENPFHWLPLLLSQFAHQGHWHLLANVGGLLAFGPLVERRIGSIGYTALTLSVGIGAGLAKVLVQGEASWGASSFTIMLLSAWLVHGSLVRWGAHKAWGRASPVARTLPWTFLATVPLFDLYLLPRGGGTLAHVFSFLAALPLIAWLFHTRQ